MMLILLKRERERERGSGELDIAIFLVLTIIFMTKAFFCRDGRWLPEYYILCILVIHCLLTGKN